MVGLVFLHAPGGKKVPWFHVCVCLSVMLLNGKVREHVIAIKLFEVRNDFDAVG